MELVKHRSWIAPNPKLLSVDSPTLGHKVGVSNLNKGGLVCLHLEVIMVGIHSQCWQPTSEPSTALGASFKKQPPTKCWLSLFVLLLDE